MERTRNTPVPRWRVDAIELIGEIALAAERIGEARSITGERIYPTDARSRFLRAIERSPYCLAIADAARALGVSRQAAHRTAYDAAALGEVDLLPNPDDQRILQIVLTPAGRSKLHAGRAIESAWLAALLNGLGDREMDATTRVVRGIRQRLERAARELARRKRIPLQS
jgi:DNA-binding MarR family transcriptional regulator